jgi:hypothetical protein
LCSAVARSVCVCERLLAGTPVRGSSPAAGAGFGSGVAGPRHLVVVLRSLARPRCGAGLPAVVAHRRHRGGNSTPLDNPLEGSIVVGYRAGGISSS